MDTENGVLGLGRQNAPQTKEGGFGEVNEEPEAGALPVPSPQPLALFMRTKEEATEYYKEHYPWLSNQILPDAAYRLARDILFKK